MAKKPIYTPDPTTRRSVHAPAGSVAGTVSGETVGSPRLAARPSAEALIKCRPGEKCVYFGDVVSAKEFTATCKADEMETAIKALCGDKEYSVARIKELVDSELAVRVRLGSVGAEKLIS